MKTFAYPLAGSPTTIYVPERRDDLAQFEEFLRRPRPALAVDSETTGLDVYSSSFGLRLVQVGDADEAWVLRFDLFADAAKRALYQAPVLVAHNAPYDLLVLDRFNVAPLDVTEGKTFDTRLLAHLIDPRTSEEGGIGHALKNLSTHYVDGTAPDTQKGLHEIFRSLKLKVSEGFAQIDIDNPTYLTYAGLDVLLTARLFAVLGKLVLDTGLSRLAEFEHEVQRITTRMQNKGLRLDVDYANKLRTDLDDQREEGIKKAALFGVENVESTQQVSTALAAMGVTFTEFTPSGKPKVDRSVLKAIAATGNELAAAVQQAKQAQKFKTAYVEACLHLRDHNDRVHPFISSLQARTARMAISRPPLQQLPAKDALIRRMFIGEPGELVVSVDFQAVELRVLAALADVKAMKKAIAIGADLHGFTADLVYGEGNWGKSERQLMKGVGFGKVYGGGATTLARQTGADIDAVKHAIAMYDRAYPEVKRYSKRLIDRAACGEKAVVTVTGRRLPLDRDRTYAGTNYIIQSTARDLLAQALVDLDDAGVTPYLSLPIHDEVLAWAPADIAQDVAVEIERVMTTPDFFGVPITADAEIGKSSWGSLYGSDQ